MSIQPNDYWCENCKLPTRLDIHLRCAICGSDQVAHNERPRDARASFGCAMYAMVEEATAKMDKMIARAEAK
jgi:predicted RNA-binding protein with PUA domain